MVEPRLAGLYAALTHKADLLQHDFSALGDALQALGRQIVNTPSGDTGPLRAEQTSLHNRRSVLAAEINIWRDRARTLERPLDEAALQAFMDELAAAGDEAVAAAVAATRAADAYAAAHPDEAPALAQPQSVANPAERLLARARTENDLRADNPAARQREAVEFANRPGLAQNDAALASLEAALADPDPFVSDMAALALIQAHRFRALRLGDLEVAHQSVRWLARSKHRAAIPVLIEILESSRSGYVPGDGGGLVEGNNRRSRLVALASLVEWRTPAAQAAIRARMRDRDPQMVAAAERALALFPGDWA